MCMQVLDGPEEGQLQPTHVQYVLALYSLLDAKCISKPVLCCISFMFTLSSIQLTTDDGTNKHAQQVHLKTETVFELEFTDTSAK